MNTSHCGTRRCPWCGGDGVRKITSRRQLKTRLPGGDSADDDEWNQAFVFRLPRECGDCGAIWVPGLPRWLGTTLVVVGVLLLLFFLGLPIYLYFFVPARRNDEYVYVSGFLVVGSIALLGYGWHVARGGASSPRFLRDGEDV